MCEHGTSEIVRLWVAPALSYTGDGRWADIGIDQCIAPLVRSLQAGGIDMLASCCGHGNTQGRIDLADGRILLIESATSPNAGATPVGTPLEVDAHNSSSSSLLSPVEGRTNDEDTKETKAGPTDAERRPV